MAFVVPGLVAEHDVVFKYSTLNRPFSHPALPLDFPRSSWVSYLIKSRSWFPSWEDVEQIKGIQVAHPGSSFTSGTAVEVPIQFRCILVLSPTPGAS